MTVWTSVQGVDVDIAQHLASTVAISAIKISALVCPGMSVIAR